MVRWFGDLARVEEPLRARGAFVGGDRVIASLDTLCGGDRLKEEAFVSREAAGLLHESGGLEALGVGCDLLAVEPVAVFVRKGEHRDGDVGGAVVAEAGEAGTHFIGIRCGDEISVMGATVLFDELDPGACVGLKRVQLGEIEGVANLTCHWLRVGHGFLRVTSSLA